MHLETETCFCLVSKEFFKHATQDKTLAKTKTTELKIQLNTEKDVNIYNEKPVFCIVVEKIRKSKQVSCGNEPEEGEEMCYI